MSSSSFIVVFLFIDIVTSFTQSVGVKGVLTCGNSPLPDIEISLWENYLPDGGLATTKSDGSGRFSLSASLDSPSFLISPLLRIFPHCNSDQTMLRLNELCQREATYQIPSSFVNIGSMVFEWYDMGRMNMEVRQVNERAECSPSPFQGSETSEREGRVLAQSIPGK
ncbi:hypothetical protein PMAYCL1PPCAC_29973 [Pristionchus mayeri]|uniref:Transthyretin-like family protein n=1 Tax=Pristionchus mayeri TaxID=1317129 RepID=A0AAN5DA82_9BILA|nr:hypothetical protein PMAYCL1PPCAC_29973 [Pristionchus mayeri]